MHTVQGKDAQDMLHNAKAYFRRKVYAGYASYSKIHEEGIYEDICIHFSIITPKSLKRIII